MTDIACRRCPGCGIELIPHGAAISGLTAHEFRCLKEHPDKIPAEKQEVFNRELAHERRSQAAFRSVETRRRNGGKRAPHKHGWRL